MESNEMLEKIMSEITQLKAKKERIKRETDEINELAIALAKAQNEMDIARNTNINPFFKSRYADLASVVKASRPHLASNGLSVLQRMITSEQGRMYLYTRLLHSSGQWIESSMPINPPKGDIQSIGSYITYLKRYTYSSMVGVVSSDEDDDGEAAMKKAREQKEQKPQNPNINKAQLKELADVLDGDTALTSEILKGYKINKLADLPQNKFHSCVGGIKQRKEKNNEK
jgi:hypothetical protein